MLNPHFDQGRVVWSDALSGQYDPVEYDDQFELQWRLALNDDDEYASAPGSSIDDAYIDDRVYEWTGEHPSGASSFNDSSMGVRVLDHPIDRELIEGRNCIDIGCGMGRWTRTLQRIGAREVLSVDVSESALESTRRFNPNVLYSSIFELTTNQRELEERFDFAVLWGVAHHTHDPKRAFENAASTVKPGGALYLMVYAPEGMHNRPLTTTQRRKFHALETTDDRLDFAAHVRDRRWDSDYGLYTNLRNLLRNMLDRPKGSKIGVLDMLEPFYNWVIPLEVISGWMAGNGFTNVTVLNERERPKVAFHVLGTKAAN